MTPQEMHDFLARRYRRRSLLKGAAAAAAAAAGPVLWRQSAASAATLPAGPQWSAFGPDPKSEMFVSWSAGSASATGQTPPKPMIRCGLDTSYGNAEAAEARQVPVPAGVSGEPAENTFYNRALIPGLDAGTMYHYSVSNDGVTWGPDTAGCLGPPVRPGCTRRP